MIDSACKTMPMKKLRELGIQGSTGSFQTTAGTATGTTRDFKISRWVCWMAT